jgi:eukaryotic-like serine/threonine-protein kinase
MPGQILGDRYEVEQQLGKKSGRWTLLARDLVTQDPVILKVLCIDDEVLADDLTRFKREVETLQSLHYPGTPRYLGYFEMDLPKSGKALTLIQSYMAGTALQTYLEQGRTFDPAEVQQIGISVLETLVHLHDHQPSIVHRDIKPSNLLLTGMAEHPADGQIYLIDFGSVRFLASSEFTATTFTTTSIAGSDGYMPPEQMGRRAVKASDLYSLGVTLITALTGTPATGLPREGLQIVVEQVVSCDPAFIRWLQQMTEPELEQRFDSAQTALAELRRLR